MIQSIYQQGSKIRKISVRACNDVDVKLHIQYLKSKNLFLLLLKSYNPFKYFKKIKN